MAGAYLPSSAARSSTSKTACHAAASTGDLLPPRSPQASCPGSAPGHPSQEKLSSEEDNSPLFVRMAATLTGPLTRQGHRLLKEPRIMYLPGQPSKAAVTVIPISQMGSRDTNRAAHPDPASRTRHPETDRETNLSPGWGPTNLFSQPTLIEDT